MTAWFIESWSPQDGIAFAQKRDGDSAILTVALTPPTWHPLEVGRATARRAERGPFQVGFFDASLQAIAFETLADLIDVVRQAYIGSAGGPPPADGVPANWNFPVGPRPGPMDSHAATAWPKLRTALAAATTDVAARKVATDLEQELGAALDQSFATFKEYYFPRESLWPPAWPQDRLDLHKLLQRMGSAHGWWTFSSDSQGTVPPVLVGLAGLEAQVTSVVFGLLFRISSPTRLSLGSHPPPGTLGDCLARVMCSRHFSTALSVDDFSICLFAASLVVAGTGLHQIEKSVPQTLLAQVRFAAVVWLCREQPRVASTSKSGIALQNHFDT